jgi:hypothetical protein
MESLSTFYNGLNQEIGYDKLQNTFYYSMLNGTLVTPEGLTEGNPSNLKGNKLFITIPNVYSQWKGYVNSLTQGQAYSFNITINGQVLAISGTYSTDVAIFQQIKVAIEANNILTNVLGVRSAYNNNNIVIWSIIVNATITSSVPAEFDIYTSILSQISPKIIGWGLIREDIYLFTTTDNTIVGGYGQIWKLTYNKITLAPTLTLIYNADIRFTTLHPFPNPGGVIGIYENIEIQRLYFTDNFNRLRGINVANPNLMALDPSLLNTTPSLNFDSTILQKIEQGGILNVGTYQAAYRLSNAQGAVTTISPVSNLVSIVPLDEALSVDGREYITYKGAAQGTSTNKRIKWQINNLDTDFDQIEVIILRRESLNQVPIIEVLPAQPIPTSGSYIFSYAGNEPVTTLTLTEFSQLSGTFTHCKAIAVKDSILFAGNTRRERQDISFDARAYRANSASSFQVTNQATTVTFNSANAQTPNFFAETDDTINPNQDTFKYRSDGTTLGGDGPQISYEFGTIALRADSTLTFTNELSDTTATNFRHTNPNFNISNISFNTPDINNIPQSYPLNSINSGTKFAYYSSVLRDYQRDEIYRFAIQFFDTEGNPFFAKWIGDIKMPSNYDNNINAIYEDNSPAPIADFRLTFTANRVGYSEAFTNHLHIKFFINIPTSVRNQISGYRIVRVKREEKDKTIKGVGLLNQTQLGGFANAPDVDMYIPTSDFSTAANTYLNALGDTSALAGYCRPKNYTFDSPDFLLSSAPSFVDGDQIRVIGKLSPTAFASLNVENQTISAIERYKIAKWYDFIPIGFNSNNYDIEKAIELISGQSYNLQGVSGSPATGYVFHNFTRETDTGTAPSTFHIDDGSSLCSKTMFLELKTDLLYNGNYNGSVGNGYKLLAHYYRPNANQYGGNTYSSRTLNEYINASEFRPISQGTVNIVDTPLVYGGDVFTSIYDNQKSIKYWTRAQAAINTEPQVGGAFIDPSSNQKRSYSMFFPSQSVVNADLRHGHHPNVEVFNNTGTGADSIYETYDYNLTYSNENDTQIYVPKPLDFITTSENDNRIYGSSPKISGETRDSWTVFPANSFIDVDGIHGPINQLISFNNVLFFWQDRAFGTVGVNDRSVVQDTSGTGLAVGSGGILDRRDYVSTTIGSKHQFSFSIGPENIFWLDILQQRFFILSKEGFKELEGLTGYFNTHIKGNILNYDNPFINLGCTSTYDYTYGNFTTSLVSASSIRGEQAGFSLSYNPSLNRQGAFHSFYSYLTAGFVNDKQNYFAISANLNELWIMHEGAYGSYFDVVSPFEIDYIANPNPAREKVFDNLELNTTSYRDNNTSPNNLPFDIDQKQDTFTEIRVFNAYQNSNWVPLNYFTVKRIKRIWNFTIQGNRVKYLNATNYSIFDNANLYTYPDRKPIPDRIKSNYAFINLRYNNFNNNKLTLESVNNIFRQNPR